MNILDLWRRSRLRRDESGSVTAELVLLTPLLILLLLFVVALGRLAGARLEVDGAAAQAARAASIAREPKQRHGHGATDRHRGAELGPRHMRPAQRGHRHQPSSPPAVRWR